MKTAKLIRIWELVTGTIILIALVILAFLRAGGFIDIHMDSLTILCFVIPALIKFKKAKMLKELD